MTTEDIKTNPGLFERKYKTQQQRISELSHKITNKDSLISSLRLEIRNLKSRIKEYETKEQIKSERGKNLSIRNKMAEIFKAIEPHYPGITFESVFKKGRKRENVEARFFVWYFMREKYHLPWKVLGQATGFDHSSAINGCNRIEEMSNIYKSFRQKVEQIRKEVREV